MIEIRESEVNALSLAMQSGLPYVGLRDVAPDPNLMLYLPAAVAGTAEMVPLSLEGNRLQLACASPESDTTAIETRFPRLEIERLISPADEIRELVGRLSEGGVR